MNEKEITIKNFILIGYSGKLTQLLFKFQFFTI